MICSTAGDIKSAIVLIIQARSTGRFYMNRELAENEKICKAIGMDAFVSGKRKERECLFISFERECREETGIEYLGLLGSLTIIMEPLHFKPWHSFDVTVGYIIVDKEFDGSPKDDEVAFKGWVTEEEIRALSFECRETRLETHAALDLFMETVQRSGSA